MYISLVKRQCVRDLTLCGVILSSCRVAILQRKIMEGVFEDNKDKPRLLVLANPMMLSEIINKLRERCPLMGWVVETVTWNKSLGENRKSTQGKLLAFGIQSWFGSVTAIVWKWLTTGFRGISKRLDVLESKTVASLSECTEDVCFEHKPARTSIGLSKSFSLFFLKRHPSVDQQPCLWWTPKPIPVDTRHDLHLKANGGADECWTPVSLSLARSTVATPSDLWHYQEPRRHAGLRSSCSKFFLVVVDAVPGHVF